MRATKKPPTITLEDSRWQLAKLWLPGAGAIVLILIIQSVFRQDYRGKLEEIWGWLLPTVLPTLSLIITVLKMDISESRNKRVKIKRSFHDIAYWMSAAYLLTVVLTFIVEPFARYDALQLLTISNFWLAPFQGLVVSTLGALFFTEPAESEKSLSENSAKERKG